MSIFVFLLPVWVLNGYLLWGTLRFRRGKDPLPFLPWLRPRSSKLSWPAAMLYVTNDGELGLSVTNAGAAVPWGSSGVSSEADVDAKIHVGIVKVDFSNVLLAELPEESLRIQVATQKLINNPTPEFKRTVELLYQAIPAQLLQTVQEAELNPYQMSQVAEIRALSFKVNTVTRYNDILGPRAADEWFKKALELTY